MSLELYIEIVVISILLAISAFFSASETGIIGLSGAKLHKLKTIGNKRAIQLTKLREDKERLIGTILLGNNFVNTAASAVATSITIELFGDSGWALATATFIMTALILVYSEVMPKTYAVRNAEKVALFVVPLCNIFFKIFSPITVAVQFIVDKTLKLMSRESSIDDLGITGSDILRGAIEIHHEEGHVVREDKYMLGGVIDLEEISNEEIMIHRNNIKSVDFSLTTEDIVNFIISSPHSRIPIFENSPDNIIGILHTKDLLRLIRDRASQKISHKELRKIMREPWFVPTTNSIKRQLSDFREHHSHIAIVVDEYGELMGLITLEDILEEVVGQIADEHDIENNNIIKNQDGSATVFGEVTIRDLNREMDWNITDNEVSTISGLMYHLARDVPNVGQVLKSGEYRFKLLRKKGHKLIKIKILKKAKPT